MLYQPNIRQFYYRSSLLSSLRLHNIPTVFLFTAALLLSTMQQTVAYTIVIGLNPALQKRFILSPKTPFLTPGSVHRAVEIQEGIGGKGQDVYVALHCLSSYRSNGGNHLDHNHHRHVKLVQFLGNGAEGDTVLSYFLGRYDKDMDLSLTIRNSDKLRICTTIVNSDEPSNFNVINKSIGGGSTELIEPSGTIQPKEIEELRHALKSLAIEDNCLGNQQLESISGICIMGTMPPGCPSSLYAELYRIIMSKHKNNVEYSPLCLIDSVIGLDHLFHEMNLHRNTKKKTNMLKINLEELCMITETRSEVSEVANAEIDRIKRAMKGLYKKFPESRNALSFVSITNGMYPAYMVHVNNDQSIPDDKDTYNNDVIYRFSIPLLSSSRPPLTYDSGNLNMGEDTKLYTIGAGDAVTACTLAAWEYLTNKKSDQRLDESIRASLLKSVVFGEDIANTAFSFGLACGTASCIEKENSVFNIPYALRLFEQMERPKKM